MAYPVPNIEQWVYGMKTIVELNDSLLAEIKHHAARHHTALRAVLERVPHHFLKRWTVLCCLSACGARCARGAARRSEFRRKTGTRFDPASTRGKRIIAVDIDSAEKSSTRPGKSALLTRATPRATARQAATLTTSAWGCGRTGSRRSARTGSRRAPICGGCYKRLGSRRRSAHISCGIGMPPIC